MPKARSQQQRKIRAAAASLLVAVLGLATALFSGLALMPRVRLVEVLTVVAGGIGGGAALTLAIAQFKQVRAAQRDQRP
jgi:hypothetical protein